MTVWHDQPPLTRREAREHARDEAAALAGNDVAAQPAAVEAPLSTASGEQSIVTPARPSTRREAAAGGGRMQWAPSRGDEATGDTQTDDSAAVQPATPTVEGAADEVAAAVRPTHGARAAAELRAAADEKTAQLRLADQARVIEQSRLAAANRARAEDARAEASTDMAETTVAAGADTGESDAAAVGDDAAATGDDAATTGDDPAVVGADDAGTSDDAPAAVVLPQPLTRRELRALREKDELLAGGTGETSVPAVAVETADVSESPAQTIVEPAAAELPFRWATMPRSREGTGRGGVPQTSGPNSADRDGADLDGTALEQPASADLDETGPDDTDLEGADLEGADLEGADLDHTDLDDTGAESAGPVEQDSNSEPHATTPAGQTGPAQKGPAQTGPAQFTPVQFFTVSDEPATEAVPAAGRNPFDSLFVPPASRQTVAPDPQAAELLLAPQAALGAEPAVIDLPDQDVVDRPFGHWSTQAALDDANQSTDAVLSRNVALTTGAITTNALVLPSTPDSGQQSHTLLTGEVLLTGSIDLPRSFGSTGAHPALFDHPDVDALIDAADREDAAAESAPVRAIRAVSSNTSSRGVIEAPLRARSRLPLILGIIGGALVLIAVTALVVSVIFNAF